MTKSASESQSPPLPPSCKYVLHVVEEEGPITRQELLAETDLEERTLDRALGRLQNGDFITKTRKSDDLRKVVVTTARV